MKTGKQRALNVLMNVLLIIYAIFALFPLLWMLLISFKSDTEVFTTTFIFHPTLANYQHLLSRFFPINSHRKFWLFFLFS